MSPSEWAAIRPQAIVWRDWGDSGAVYDAASGSTHVLDALALELLCLLVDRPRRLDELVVELRDAMPAEIDPQASQGLIESRLRTLASLDLAVSSSRAA